MSRTILTLALLAGCRFGFESDDTAPRDGGGDDVAITVDAADRPNRMFAMYPVANGNFGGLAGADAICQARADSRSLGGTWLAILWSSAGGPSLRFAGSRGWVDLAGTPLVDRAEDLDHANLRPLRIDDMGAPITMTGAHAFRGDINDHCNDWTSDLSDGVLAYELYAAWDNDSYLNCSSTTAAMICAETGHVAAQVPTVEPGRIAFISETGWIPTGGLAAADAVCQGEATAAGLPGTFAALLTTSNATAESRFSSAGLPWRRVDGIRVTADLAVPLWDSFIARTAGGAVTRSRTWYGSTTQNCNDWTGGTTAMGVAGKSHHAATSRLANFINTGCGSSHNLICLQQ